MRIKLSIPLSLRELSLAIGNEDTVFDNLIEYISTDTRELSPGDLFITLKGENHNGADFLNEAKMKGAFTLSEDKSSTIFTKNINDAILKLITYYKAKLTGLKYTVLITGSVGKTSAKEFLYKLCIEKYKTHSTYKNYNNIYGVMHTVLSADRSTEVLIVEVGMNRKGEISPISQALSPDIVVITNVGSAHIGNLGSREEIANAKLEICEGLSNGVTIIPEDEPLLSNAKNAHLVSINPSRYNTLIIPLSITQKGSFFDFYSDNVFLRGLQLKIPGEHILKTFSLALATAVKLKLTEGQINSAIKKINEGLLRQGFIKSSDFLIYDDSYSSSYEALVETVKMLLLYKTDISCVLSDILELGDVSEDIHYKAGYTLASLGVKQLFLIGEFRKFYMQGAIDGGMNKDNIHINNMYSDFTFLAKSIKEKICGKILLIKGSHKTGLSELIKKLKE